MDLPVVEKSVPAILMNCDNQTVIAKVKSSKDNMKSNKHIRMRLKAVRKLRNSEVIALDYIQRWITLHVGGWVRHMPKDGLSWWGRVEHRRCLETG